MLLTGFQIQNKLRTLGFEREMLYSEFRDSLWVFPDEVKRDPLEIADQLFRVETNIAKVQEVQARFNLAVQVVIDGNEISLHEAVKRIGGAGRLGKLWRTTATDTGKNRLFGHQRTIAKDTIIATKKVNPGAATEQAILSSNYESELRAAIQVANSQSVEIEVDPDLFE